MKRVTPGTLAALQSLFAHIVNPNPVVKCGDCNGTGVDYDANCRAVACRTCGGGGFLNAQSSGEQP